MTRVYIELARKGSYLTFIQRGKSLRREFAQLKKELHLGVRDRGMPALLYVNFSTPTTVQMKEKKTK